MSAYGELINDPGFNDRYAGLFDSSLSLRVTVAGKIMGLTGFVFNAGILSEADYSVRRDSVLASLQELEAGITAYVSQLEAFRTDLDGQGKLSATVLIKSVDVLSEGQPTSTLNRVPAAITLRASISNLSNIPAGGLSAQLVVPGLGPDVVYSNQIRDLPTLAAGATNILEWTVNFNGPETLGQLVLQVQLRSSDGSVYIPGFSEVVLPVLLDADRDGDLLPDGYEEALGPRSGPCRQRSGQRRRRVGQPDGIADREQPVGIRFRR